MASAIKYLLKNIIAAILCDPLLNKLQDGIKVTPCLLQVNFTHKL